MPSDKKKRKSVHFEIQKPAKTAADSDFCNIVNAMRYVFML
jgi:hypothetical protein